MTRPCEMIEFNRDHILGRGRFSTVYRGTHLGGLQVAVKVIDRDHEISAKDKRDYGLLKMRHLNVVRLIFIQDRDNDEHGSIRLFALGLAHCTMAHIFLPEDDPKKFQLMLPSDLHVLNQLSKGLEHIHDRGCVHGSIKPSNVLIVFSNQDHPVPVFQWSDFGLGPSFTDEGSPQKYPIEPQWKAENWMAPETLEWRVKDVGTRRVTTESDVFVAGMLFFYFLVGGVHPFGYNYKQINDKILEGKPINFAKLSPSHIALEIIQKMLIVYPTARIKMYKVVQELTQKVQQRLLGLCSLVNPRHQDLEEFIRLLNTHEDDINVNDVDEDGLTPLLLLCRYNRSPHLREWLDKLLTLGSHLRSPIDVHHRDREGNNAVLHLCRNYFDFGRFSEVIAFFVRNDFNVNVQEEVNGWSCLHFIIANCFREGEIIDVIRLLFNAGIDVNLKCKRGFNALNLIRKLYPHAANEEGTREIVRMLKARGADGFEFNGCFSCFKCCLPITDRYDLLDD